mmetsp:Transcript_91865/g.218865  ORF Transcript_91865/g.218865 Transcript_91865/m.218865 type:complete len:83 (-) Transcript_91865:556-804(-)
MALVTAAPLHRAPCIERSLEIVARGHLEKPRFRAIELEKPQALETGLTSWLAATGSFCAARGSCVAELPEAEVVAAGTHAGT